MENKCHYCSDPDSFNLTPPERHEEGRVVHYDANIVGDGPLAGGSFIECHNWRQNLKCGTY